LFVSFFIVDRRMKVKKTMKLYTAIAALLAISSPSSAEEGTPPWDSLASALGSSSSLTEPTIDAFVSECAGEFLSDPTITEEIGGDPPPLHAAGREHLEYVGPAVQALHANTVVRVQGLFQSGLARARGLR
jgi:hypothetical protein